jgi:hypothetical protein
MNRYMAKKVKDMDSFQKLWKWSMVRPFCANHIGYLIGTKGASWYSFASPDGSNEHEQKYSMAALFEAPIRSEGVMPAKRIVRVGIIGCGEVSQVVHIPTLGFLSDFFTITYICDVSADAVKHSAQKIINHVPKTTQDYKELCASKDVDLVLIASSDEYHAMQAIEALSWDKYVFIEKPMALCMRDAKAIIEAERKSTGIVMVGYMRRYAAAFVDAVKEVGGMDKILYARVRGAQRILTPLSLTWLADLGHEDIIGPNYRFVGQSGTFPRVFDDFSQAAIQDKKDRAEELVHQGLTVDCGLSVTDQSTQMWRLLGSLGSHDLSAMREILGMPKRVVGALLKQPFWR